MLRARTLKIKLTPMQIAIDVMGRDIKEYLKDKSDSDAMVYKTSTPGPHFLENFKKGSVLHMKGRTWNPRTKKIDVIELKDILWGAGPYAGAHRERTLCFVGQEAQGKSTFIHGLAREMCQRTGMEQYAYGGSIDPYGLLTRTGHMNKMGCFCFSDFELKSKLSERLSMEDIKQFLFVQERASIGARHHVAVFPEHIPRLWAINSGLVEMDGYGRAPEMVESPGHWFEREDRGLGNCIALKHLAEGNEEWLTYSASAHQRAQARRIIIFETKDLFDVRPTGSAIDQKRHDLYEEELLRATPCPTDM